MKRLKIIALFFFIIYNSYSQNVLSMIDIGLDASRVQDIVESTVRSHYRAQGDRKVEMATDTKYKNGTISTVILCMQNTFLFFPRGPVFVDYCKYYVMNGEKLAYVITEYKNLSTTDLKTYLDFKLGQTKIDGYYFNDNYQHYSTIILTKNELAATKWCKTDYMLLPKNIKAKIEIQKIKNETQKEANDIQSNEKIYTVVGQQPQFSTGKADIITLIEQNLNYPREAAQAGVEGKVLVSVVVHEDGNLGDVHVVKGIGYGCDEEALRIVNMSSLGWNPGKQNGRSVKVKITIPVDFQITKKAKIENQEEINDSLREEEIFTIVEQQPQFPEGIAEMMSFIRKNIVYPEEARKNGTEGKVLVEFIVEKDGQLRNIRINKGIGYGCDEEALRVVNIMPKWNSGKQNGRSVKVRMTITINFQIGSRNKK